jgi:predicted outer membrane protein
MRTKTLRLGAAGAVVAAVSAFTAASALAVTPKTSFSDEQFVLASMQTSCFEVASAQFALRYWHVPAVRELALRMRHDHAAALTKLEPLAMSLKLPRTTSLTPIQSFVLAQFALSVRAASGSAVSGALPQRTAPRIPALPAGSLAAKCAAKAPSVPRTGGAAKNVAAAPKANATNPVPAAFRFDRFFALYQEAAHKAAIADTSKEVRLGSDPRLVALAKAQLPMLRLHLHLAQVAAESAAVYK